MPELPEVESVRRVLAAEIAGRTATAAGVTHPRMLRRQPTGTNFGERLIGRRVERVDRRGKFLFSRIDGGSTWIVHLGMSGRVRLTDPLSEVEQHTHVRVRFGDQEVRVVDPRTFGFTAVVTAAELDNLLEERVGRDALLDLPDPEALSGWLRGRSAPIKALLLDQRFISGLGNIYTDEILFRAGIRGVRAGGSLSRSEIEHLHAAVRPVLEEALRDGGTTLDDLAYLLPDGRAASHVARLAVYGRYGRSCGTCDSTIRRARVAGRTTCWCPTCQT